MIVPNPAAGATMAAFEAELPDTAIVVDVMASAELSLLASEVVVPAAAEAEASACWQMRSTAAIATMGTH